MTSEVADSRHASTTQAVRSIPCPLIARAWSGDVLLAESDATVRLERDGLPPALLFPVGSILARADLEAVLAPTDDVGQPDFVCIDHHRARVELIDPIDPDDQRSVTVKRFPTWGDATDLIAMLDVVADGEDAYYGAARGGTGRAVVEGSQMLGQAIVAASREHPGRRCVSAHMAFFRVADAAEPLSLRLRRASAGRSFATVGVDVGQGGRPCATGTVLLDATEADLLRHAIAPPDVPGPFESPSLDMSVTGRDVRVVDGAYTGDPEAPVGPPVLDAWVRFRALPEDPPLHAALLAQFTSHMSIAAALRPHAGVGQAQAHRTMSTAINAIALSLHAEVRADRWMLYHHESVFAGDGMTRSQCRVHDEDGALLATFSVDAMVRRLDKPAPADERRAL